MFSATGTSGSSTPKNVLMKNETATRHLRAKKSLHTLRTEYKEMKFIARYSVCLDFSLLQIKKNK